MHKRINCRTQNVLYNLTPYAYTKRNPLPDAHTFVVLDHNGECVDEFDEWEDARKCYLNQSPETLVGAWLIYGVCMVQVH